jgi:hypothetical protein
MLIAAGGSTEQGSALACGQIATNTWGQTGEVAG